jgi:hypothetical protein
MGLVGENRPGQDNPGAPRAESGRGIEGETKTRGTVRYARTGFRRKN